MPLDVKTRRRLTQLMGMTGSAINAEALSFLRAAQKLIHDNNETWESVLLSAADPPEQSWTPPTPPEPYYFPVLHEIKVSVQLTKWERDFVDSLLERRWPTLSQKQKDIVGRIYARVRDPAY